jgi:hypothetical protein
MANAPSIPACVCISGMIHGSLPVLLPGARNRPPGLCRLAEETVRSPAPVSRYSVPQEHQLERQDGAGQNGVGARDAVRLGGKSLSSTVQVYACANSHGVRMPVTGTCGHSRMLSFSESPSSLLASTRRLPSFIRQTVRTRTLHQDSAKP